MMMDVVGGVDLFGGYGRMKCSSCSRWLKERRGVEVEAGLLNCARGTSILILLGSA